MSILPMSVKTTFRAAMAGAAFLAGLAGFTVSGIATAIAHNDGDRAEEKLAGYEKTGDSVNCLRLSMVRDSAPLNDYQILFEVRGGAMFLNDLNGRCTGLERERRFSYTTPQAQICEGDIISVTDNFGTFRGSCSLGEFQALSTTAQTH